MSIQNFNPSVNLENQGGLIPKILVVEADPALAEILAELFRSSGYSCMMVRECENIIPIIESYRPDLVLTEYLLPIVNGGELCNQVKEDQRFREIPVILYSAYPQLLWSVSDYGCDEFISKPFDLDELLQKVEKLLSKRKEKRRFSLLADGLKNRVSYLERFLGC